MLTVQSTPEPGDLGETPTLEPTPTQQSSPEQGELGETPTQQDTETPTLTPTTEPTPTLEATPTLQSTPESGRLEETPTEIPTETPTETPTEIPLPEDFENPDGESLLLGWDSGGDHLYLRRRWKSGKVPGWLGLYILSKPVL